ncbi:hypothetical protein PG985_014486 [Apiospora marii]|uniref:2EXR domain-containing protein n=1 Tax=Apiospora marii TaxID=335849 RepID=A0ABR1R4R8_9PEZI
MAFTRFSDLPPELQVIVWKFALLAESQDRVVLLHRTNYIIPQRHLISPFLRTCSISRDEALRFYTVALEVKEFPLLPQPIPLDNAERKVQYGLTRMHMLPRRGNIYLNPNHDTFITGLSFTMHFVDTSGVETRE